MKYKNGEEARVGDVIRWRRWDSDDYTTWTFTGLVKEDRVIYLGGGIDFGLGIGNAVSFEEVIEESENNDAEDVGVDKIGIASDLARHISNFNYINER